MPLPSTALKIGFVFDDSLDSNDGVAQYVKTLGTWFSSQGHKVCYLVGESKTTQWSGGQVYSLARNQRVVFNGNRLSIPLPAKRSSIKRVLEQEDFDVLHVQLPHSPFMAQKVINAAGSKTAIFGTFHIMPSSWLTSVGSRFLRLLYGRGLSCFDKIFSVSAPAAGFARAAFGLDTTELPNVVDMNRFKMAGSSWKRNNPPRIVFLGRLVERKGASELLKAFKVAEVKAELVIAGDGPLRGRLENFVKKYRLESRVKFLGFIDEKDKPRLLNNANIACFPSLYGESFGIVLIEAMAAGAGVVLGGNNPGYSSVLTDKQEMLVNPRDTYQFAARLQRLLTDEELISTLHDWQIERVRRYDVPIVGQRLLDEYAAVIAKK